MIDHLPRASAQSSSVACRLKGLRQLKISSAFFDRLEILLAIAGIALFSGVLPAILPGIALKLARYAIWLAALGFSVFRRPAKTLQVLSNDYFICILIVLSCLSFLWSDYPQNTISRAIELLRMSTFGVYLAATFRPEDRLKALSWVLALAAVLSAIYAFILPGIAIHYVDHPGAWKGIYEHKNTLGAVMVLSAIAFYLKLLFNPVNSISKCWLDWGGLGLSILLILQTTSKSSLLLLFFILAAIYQFKRYRWRGKTTILFLSLGLLLIGSVTAISIANWNEILLGLDRNPTLSGRTLIWDYAFERLSDRPWLGFGRGSFWTAGGIYQIEAGQRFSLGLEYLPPHSHNGFIDMLLDVGAIGFACFVLSWGIGYCRALSKAYYSNRAGDWFPLCFLTTIVANNFTESLLMRDASINIFWVLYLASVFSLGQARPSLSRDSK
ncbi:O-antigen ligase [Synechococcus sp. PCC 7336]|uniref:O-antigen ligase family protein n=1 Tax=Synechococcus sp. PCC 7336 TaxID=195250 RepID=UPI00034888A7|nr:O-antigen ligase family protein [Synechococcus sp. PCC 7336]